MPEGSHAPDPLSGKGYGSNCERRGHYHNHKECKRFVEVCGSRRLVPATNPMLFKLARCAGSRLSHDEFGFDHNRPRIGVVIGTSNPPQQSLGGHHAHFFQGLADGG